LPVNKFQVQKLLLLLLLIFFVSFIYTIIKLSSGRLTRNLAGQLLPISGLKKKKNLNSTELMKTQFNFIKKI
jgi:hypothetical protein